MVRFRVKYALGGGFGGIEFAEWEEAKGVRDIEEAMSWAKECAREEYFMYDGTQGLLNEADVMEEEGCSYEEATRIVNEDIESWIDYDAREINAG